MKINNKCFNWQEVVTCASLLKFKAYVNMFALKPTKTVLRRVEMMNFKIIRRSLDLALFRSIKFSYLVETLIGFQCIFKLYI